jgi:hypothetical protein
MFTAWLSYVISLFIPSVTFLYEPVKGWAAALFSIHAIIQFYKSLFLAYISLFGLCNILMLLSPLFVLFLFKKGKFFWYRAALCAATVPAVSYFFYEGLRYRFFELKSGYYFWTSSFVLAGLSLLTEMRSYHRN